MAKTKISVENFRDYYLKQNKPRSIRRLHTELREQFKNKSLVSLPTIFRHSKSEDWRNLCISVDQKSSAIAMENIVEKKAVQLTEITEQLKETSDKALQIVLQNLNNIKSLDKVADIGTISKVAIESAKLSNLFSGGADKKGVDGTYTFNSDTPTNPYWCFSDSSAPGPPSVPGCMDSTAANYNPEATTDDGSCYKAGTEPPVNCDPDAHPPEQCSFREGDKDCPVNGKCFEGTECDHSQGETCTDGSPCPTCGFETCYCR
jgi:hypothetical protein